MRWGTAAVLVVVFAGAALVEIELQRRRVGALTEEVHALRGAGQAPAVLDERERDLLAAAIAARVADGLPAPAAQPAGPPPAAAATRAAVAEAPAPAAPTASQRNAAESAQRVFDEALSLGTLRREHVEQLRQILAQTDPGSANDLRRRISMALNRDELRIADPAAGMP